LLRRLEFFEKVRCVAPLWVEKVENGSAGWALRLKEDQRQGSSFNGFKADEADVKIAAITNGLAFSVGPWRWAQFQRNVK